MQQFFNAIVHLFEAVCRHSGLRYAELNILVYCLLLPAFWCGIVWLRTRNLGWLLLVFFALILVYVFEKGRIATFSISFYRQNIAALEYLGAYTKWGYVSISLFLGVLVPLLLSAILALFPKKWLTGIYLGYLAVNWAYYGWVVTFVQ